MHINEEVNSQRNPMHEEPNAYMSSTYCVEMREAFKGIKVDADSNEADQLTKRLEKTRRLNHAKSYKQTLSENYNKFAIEKRLHWTIKPCHVPSNNWYVCEKSAENENKNSIYQHSADHKRKKSINGDITSEGKRQLTRRTYF